MVIRCHDGYEPTSHRQLFRGDLAHPTALQEWGGPCYDGGSGGVCWGHGTRARRPRFLAQGGTAGLCTTYDPMTKDPVGKYAVAHARMVQLWESMRRYGRQFGLPSDLYHMRTLRMQPDAREFLMSLARDFYRRLERDVQRLGMTPRTYPPVSSNSRDDGRATTAVDCLHRR